MNRKSRQHHINRSKGHSKGHSKGYRNFEPEVDARELLEFLVQQVVDKPSEVMVQRRGRNLLVQVAAGEEGRLIGRQGRVIQALRSLARAAEPKSRLSVEGLSAAQASKQNKQAKQKKANSRKSQP